MKNETLLNRYCDFELECQERKTGELKRIEKNLVGILRFIPSDVLTNFLDIIREELKSREEEENKIEFYN